MIGDQISFGLVFTNTRKMEKAIPLTRSDVIAEQCWIEHRAAKQLITEYIDKFNKLETEDKHGVPQPVHLKYIGKNGTKSYKTWYEKWVKCKE